MRSLVAMSLVFGLAFPVLGQTAFTLQPECGLELAVAGAWDGGGLNSRDVLFEDGMFRMWYAASDNGGGRGGHQLGYASSEDGCTWTRHALNPFIENLLPWESFGIRAPAVVHDADGYKLWYTGFTDATCSIGHAFSESPFEFERYGNRPVISPEQSNPDGRACQSTVVRRGGTYLMWYTSRANEQTRLQLATSPDGVRWEEYRGNPVLVTANIHSPTVRFDATTSSFDLWYQNGANFVWASSLDGKSWTSTNNLSINGEDRETFSVANPTVVRVGDTFHLWYNARDSDSFFPLIRYATGPWTQPRAAFTVAGAGFDAELARVPGPATLSFDATTSVIPDLGGIRSYTWDFGDGDTAEGPTAIHTFELGVHHPTLTVEDASGKSNTGTREIFVLFPDGPTEPWSSADIGFVEFPGSARRSGDCLEGFHATGWLGTAADRAHFLHQRFTGDFRLEATFVGWDASTSTRFGLLVRESLDPGARAAAVAQRSRTTELLTRPEPDATLASQRITSLASTDTLRLRLERRGDSVQGFVSTDAGKSWEASDSAKFDAPLPAQLLVGAAFARRSQAAEASGQICDFQLTALSDSPIAETWFQRGEANGDGALELTDAVFVLNFLFQAGQPPPCEKAADVNDDGQVDLSDPVQLLNHLFLSGDALPEPAGLCGVDATPDTLTCEEVPSCP